MDELTKPTQEEVSWCTLFEDHIVLVDGTRSGVKFKLEIWRENVELGFWLSRIKMGVSTFYSLQDLLDFLLSLLVRF